MTEERVDLTLVIVGSILIVAVFVAWLIVDWLRRKDSYQEAWRNRRKLLKDFWLLKSMSIDEVEVELGLWLYYLGLMISGLQLTIMDKLRLCFLILLIFDWIRSKLPKLKIKPLIVCLV